MRLFSGIIALVSILSVSLLSYYFIIKMKLIYQQLNVDGDSSKWLRDTLKVVQLVVITGAILVWALVEFQTKSNNVSHIIGSYLIRGDIAVKLEWFAIMSLSIFSMVNVVKYGILLVIYEGVLDSVIGSSVNVHKRSRAVRGKSTSKY